MKKHAPRKLFTAECSQSSTKDAMIIIKLKLELRITDKGLRRYSSVKSDLTASGRKLMVILVVLLLRHLNHFPDGSSFRCLWRECGVPGNCKGYAPAAAMEEFLDIGEENSDNPLSSPRYPLQGSLLSDTLQLEYQVEMR